MSEELTKKILEKFETYEECANAMDVNFDRFRKLIHGTRKWERQEIIKICVLLGIPKSDILKYFEPTDLLFVKYYMVREKIKERYGSVRNYCRIFGYDYDKLILKLKGKCEWNRNDIIHFCKIFRIPSYKISCYFGDYVTKYDLKNKERCMTELELKKLKYNLKELAIGDILMTLCSASKTGDKVVVALCQKELIDRGYDSNCFRKQNDI
jgi:hypothetical protein